jgi:hypothetical protein
MADQRSGGELARRRGGHVRRLREVLLATILVATVASCRYLPTHNEFGPGPGIDLLVAGDSYTAGNGALDPSLPDNGYYFKSGDDPRSDEFVRQEDPTDTNNSRGCFRSHKAWGEQVFQELRATEANIGSFINAACGGDTTRNVASLNSEPQLEGFTDKQRGEVDLIAMSISGNDLSFGEVVAACFATTLTGQLCDEKLRAAEAMLEVGESGQSSIQLDIRVALNKLRDGFRNAKIVLVGYPLFWEDETYTLEVCPGCGGTIRPGERLEDGLNMLNQQQEELVNQYNDASDFERFAFLPLHEVDGSGFFDGHGIHGEATPQWIHPLEIFSSQPESRVHPNVAGQTAIAENLIQLPLVQQVVRDRIRADYPKMSLTRVGDQWYALNGNGQLWTVTTDFVHCQLPNGPYKLASWKDSQQLFDAAVNRPPYDDLQGQPGCDLSIPREGDILEYLSDVHGPRYWRVSFGSEGQLLRTEINRFQDRTIECMQRDGSRLFRAPDIDPTAYQDTGGTLYSQKSTCGVVLIAGDPAGDVWWASDLPTTDDPNAGNFNDRGTTFTKATVQWMIDCFNGPQYSHIRIAVSQDLKQAFPLAGFKYGITAANCIT